MPTLLTIPDDVYSQAAAAIAALRSVNNTSVDVGKIEKELRSYVYLGITKQIQDWASTLSDDDKDAIITRVQARTQTYYALRPNYNDVYLDLESLETASYQGTASPRLARPRAAQDDYEMQQTQGIQTPSVGDATLDVIGKLFGGLKTGAEAALKGLGIDLSLGTIVIILVVFGLVFLNRSAV